MTRIVLHVGMPKTATTTIQHSLEAHSRQLLAGGILFPKSGRTIERSPCHHALFLPAASSRHAIRTPLPEPVNTFEGMQLRVEKETKEAGATSVILSSEMLWNPIAFDTPALERIRHVFVSCEFTILAYLRSLESHTLSSYAQRVTGPQLYTGSFSQHVSEAFAAGTYDYKERLDEFAHVFGRDTVRPVWLPWLGRDVLLPFRNVLPELKDVAVEKDYNVRKSWLYVAVKRRLNVLEKTRLCRLSRLVDRLFRRFDALVRKSKRLDSLLEPMDPSTRKNLEKKTEELLEALESDYSMRIF